MAAQAGAGRRYRGFGPRPELLPLREGVVDVSAMTPEKAEHLAAVTRRYPGPPVEEASRQPFVGITTDGRVVPGLFALEDTGLDPAPIASAADELCGVLDPAEWEPLSQELDSPAWRLWTNAFPTWPSPHGLRLQDLSDQKRAAVLAVVRASLSARGYGQAREAMRLNGELGRLVDQYHDTLTEWMYWFSIFGRPSSDGPWGWQLTGHHLDVHCLVLGRQLVLTPTFLGAEFASERLFAGERSLGLELVNALSPDQRARAVVYGTFADLPHELRGPVDGRHVAAAGQDNRLIPYEGLEVGALTGHQQALFRRLVEAWVSVLPEGPARARTREIERHLADTRFAWYGPTDGEAAFYYRIHSPVVLVEYDDHPGIFLDNDDPQHDYGRDRLRQHVAAHSH